jgi:hypothetical protein
VCAGEARTDPGLLVAGFYGRFNSTDTSSDEDRFQAFVGAVRLAQSGEELAANRLL